MKACTVSCACLHLKFRCGEVFVSSAYTALLAWKWQFFCYCSLWERLLLQVFLSFFKIKHLLSPQSLVRFPESVVLHEGGTTQRVNILLLTTQFTKGTVYFEKTTTQVRAYLIFIVWKPLVEEILTGVQSWYKRQNPCQETCQEKELVFDRCDRIMIIASVRLWFKSVSLCFLYSSWPLNTCSLRVHMVHLYVHGKVSYRNCWNRCFLGPRFKAFPVLVCPSCVNGVGVPCLPWNEHSQLFCLKKACLYGCVNMCYTVSAVYTFLNGSLRSWRSVPVHMMNKEQTLFGLSAWFSLNPSIRSLVFWKEGKCVEYVNEWGAEYPLHHTSITLCQVVQHN